MKTLKSVSDFLSKIEWEGGLYEAFISYGIEPSDYDIPEDIKSRIDNAVDDYWTAISELETILDELQNLAEAEDEVLTS